MGIAPKLLVLLQSTGNVQGWHRNCPTYMGSCCMLNLSFALIRNMNSFIHSANMIIADAKTTFLWVFYYDLQDGIFEYKEIFTVG